MLIQDLFGRTSLESTVPRRANYFANVPDQLGLRRRYAVGRWGASVPVIKSFRFPEAQLSELKDAPRVQTRAQGHEAARG